MGEAAGGAGREDLLAEGACPPWFCPVRGVSTSPGGSARHQGAPRSAQGPAAGRALLSLAPAPGPQEPRLLWRDPQARDMPLGPDVTCESDLHRAPFNRAIN